MDADAQIAITRNAIEAAFVDEPTRAKLMTRLDDAANETG
jgi:adenosine deaminase